MMDMVERVARGCMIAALSTTSPNGAPSAATMRIEWDANEQFWMRQGRAAILAMADPTLAMVKAGGETLSDDVYVGRGMARNAYTDMITAALQPAIDGGEG